ncbi:hypothetical protein ACEN2I_13200 [Flavobacterium sp. W22_SRS_FK3]|uniref:hypothetical protein n=1 Tax=Flavobacterium sp. W22_SRS_FK3 TaxID=3240275 RepID=UPI003F91BA25
MKTLFILISFLFLTNEDVIHQDTRLQIDNNGNIIGLPKQFNPAKFDWNKKKLRINNKELIFPKCINYYFEQKKTKLNLSASWYHSKDIMPYYLNFDISDKSITEGNTTYNPKVELGKKCLTEYKKGIKILN